MPPVTAAPIMRYNGANPTGRNYASPTNLPEVRNIFQQSEPSPQGGGKPIPIEGKNDTPPARGLYFAGKDKTPCHTSLKFKT